MLKKTILLCSLIASSSLFADEYFLSNKRVIELILALGNTVAHIDAASGKIIVITNREALQSKSAATKIFTKAFDDYNESKDSIHIKNFVKFLTRNNDDDTLTTNFKQACLNSDKAIEVNINLSDDHTNNIKLLIEKLQTLYVAYMSLSKPFSEFDSNFKKQKSFNVLIEIVDNTLTLRTTLNWIEPNPADFSVKRENNNNNFLNFS